MQLSTFTTSLIGREKSSTQPTWPPQRTSNKYFDLHPIGSVIRSLFMSSLLWVFLAFTVYSVYSYVLAAK
jgi:hypothetical protein